MIDIEDIERRVRERRFVLVSEVEALVAIVRRMRALLLRALPALDEKGALRAAIEEELR